MADKRIVDFPVRSSASDNDSVLVWADNQTYRVTYATLKNGAAPAFSIGTVTTLAPGSNATASISGTTANPVLNLGIPKGDAGYELTEADKNDIAQIVMNDLPSAVGVYF